MIFNVNEKNLNNSIEKLPQAGVFIINEAEVKKFDSGSVVLNFTATNQETKEEVKFQMFVIGKDGKETFQKRNLDKIAYCAGITGDLHTGKGKDGKEILAGLHNKLLGLMLNLKDEADREDTQKTYTKYEFFEAFCPKTKRLSSEIKDNKEANLYDSFVEKLTHKKINGHSRTNTYSQVSQKELQNSTAGMPAFDDDDFPF